MTETITLEPYQSRFMHSRRRYPAMVSAIGTGKTMMLLLKIWKFCAKYPGALALIVRKEFTDLKDSTIKDFERYFSVTVDSHKQYKFANGSTIMFRHGAEINVLKNINLSIFGIEQAEEFETDEQFIFLRDRLRREGSPYRQGCIIANANGHNWVWRLWKNNPSSEEFDLSEATTFDNAENLPKDFLDDLRTMETTAPNHYRRYVLNSHEDMDDGDLLLPHQIVEKCTKLNLRGRSSKRVLAADVARFGNDETVLTIIEECTGGWKQIYLQGFSGNDLMQTTGRIIDLKASYNVGTIVVDDIGLGGGVVDRLREVNVDVIAYVGSHAFGVNDIEGVVARNKRSYDYWMLREMIVKEQLQIINNDKLIPQLTSMRFSYTSTGQKRLETKDEMKKRGLKSPDYADALMMAASVRKRAVAKEDEIDFIFAEKKRGNYGFGKRYATAQR